MIAPEKGQVGPAGGTPGHGIRLFLLADGRNQTPASPVCSSLGPVPCSCSGQRLSWGWGYSEQVQGPSSDQEMEDTHTTQPLLSYP